MRNEWSRRICGNQRANIPKVQNWLVEAGCDPIFEVDSATMEGIERLKAYLDEGPIWLTWEQVRKRQARGITEWED